jgi:hypothetical protein
MPRRDYLRIMSQVLGAFATVFGVVAAYFLYVGITLDTAVSTGDGGTVANLQLMHIGIGIGAAVIAAIFASRSSDRQFARLMSTGTPRAFSVWKKWMSRALLTRCSSAFPS